MKNLFLGILMTLAASSAFATKPDLKVTPGELCSPADPNFSGYRYPAHVAYCRRNVTQEMKQQVAKSYGDIPESEWKNYEFDHLIPLNSGGSSNVANLWPQPLAEAHEKDVVEQATFDGLGSGKLTQDQAVQMIWDWIAQHLNN